MTTFLNFLTGFAVLTIPIGILTAGTILFGFLQTITGIAILIGVLLLSIMFIYACTMLGEFIRDEF